MFIKGFNKDLKCRGFQFEVGKTYDTGCTKDISLCSDTVFHFCDSLEKVHKYYDCGNEENRYCEIEVLGEMLSYENKMGSNKIRVVREIIGEELDELKGLKNGNTGVFNSGRYNSGDDNSGDRNTGDWNSGCKNSGYLNYGDCNTGNYNSGDFNTGNRNSGNRNTGKVNTGDNNSGDNNGGDFNTGDFNTGYYNSGDYNSGESNSGDYNSGDFNSGYLNSGYFNSGSFNSGDFNSGEFNSGNFNSGYWNKCDGSNGVFCTEEPTIKIFDKDTNMTLTEFKFSKYNRALKSAPFNLTEWIKYTEEEMENDETKRKAGGYLKEYTYKEACFNWWSKLTRKNKKIIMSIPNFDAEKFYEITGIMA